MARKKGFRELAVGAVVIAALVIVSGIVLVLGQETQLFAPKNTYRTILPDASGLRVGSPVTMAGVRIGAVSRIVLPTDPRSTGIEVFITIDRSYAERIREDTSATPFIMQLVANEKAIDLSPGDPAEPLRQEGGLIPTDIPPSIIERGGSIADSFEEITQDLESILGAISRGEGLLGQALTQENFGQEGLEQAYAVLESAHALLDKLNAGQGFIGKAMVDREWSQAISSNLATAAEALATTARRLEAGEGVLGQLVTPGEGESLVGDIEGTAASLRRFATELEQGEGLAAVLLSDEELAQRVSADLEDSVDRLASILRKIDEGEGTLGQLVNDRSLYRNANQLVQGVRESRVAMWLFRHYFDKGESEQGEGDAAPSEQAAAGKPERAGAYWPASSPVSAGGADGRADEPGPAPAAPTVAVP
jgi:phospholipid/cholesterol/gamma-HCH transport system substrate-binding protein